MAIPADALPRDEHTVIRVAWDPKAHSFCDEWEGSDLILTGRMWYLVEGTSTAVPERLAAVIDSFQVRAAPPAKVISDVIAAGGYLPVAGAAPWVITPEDATSVAERYAAQSPDLNN